MLRGVHRRALLRTLRGSLDRLPPGRAVQALSGGAARGGGVCGGFAESALRRHSPTFAPPNSLEVFEAARRHLATDVEVDLHVTTDHHLAIRHNTTIHKTSPPVSELSFSEYRGFAAGLAAVRRDIQRTADNMTRQPVPATLRPMFTRRVKESHILRMPKTIEIGAFLRAIVHKR